MWVDLARLGLVRIRPTHFIRAANTGPSRIFLGLRARGLVHFFFKKFYDKTLNVQNLRNFKKFTKLSKDFGELDDKLIIQHFHYIHIMTYIMYFLNFSTFKIHNTCLIPVIQEFETLMQ